MLIWRTIFLILIWGRGPSIVGTDGKSALTSDNTVTLKGESGSLSYLGRIAYSYADRYMLQFIFRSDASTKFAPENYWGFFPVFLPVGFFPKKDGSNVHFLGSSF